MSSWFKPRGYIHFDLPIGAKGLDKTLAYVSDPNAVAKHPFYPLIAYDQDKYKIVEDEDTGKRFLDDSGKREICYAAHLDAHIYAYYSWLLSEKYESILENKSIASSVLAFRKLKDENGKPMCNIHLAKQAFSKIGECGDCVVIALDIKGFFDNLNPKFLKEKWAETLGSARLPSDHFALFESVTKQKIVKLEDLSQRFRDYHRFEKNRSRRVCTPEDFRKYVRKMVGDRIKGIPQGLPISAILANIYMLDFDLEMLTYSEERGGYYYRYCDDIFLIIPNSSPESHVRFVETALTKIHLSLSSRKTKISQVKKENGKLAFDRPIQYLGFNFDGKAISIRPGSVTNFQNKALTAINAATTERLRVNKIRKAKGMAPQPTYKKDLLIKYTHHGKQNFISYGLRAAKIMKSETIRLQLKKINARIENGIADA